MSSTESYNRYTKHLGHDELIKRDLTLRSVTQVFLFAFVEMSYMHLKNNDTRRKKNKTRGAAHILQTNEKQRNHLPFPNHRENTPV